MFLHWGFFLDVNEPRDPSSALYDFLRQDHVLYYESPRKNVRWIQVLQTHNNFF